MEYSIEAKPTVFNGVQFRSRLEARWAAFFTILKWPWLYEPVDLGEWTPDFIVDAATTLLVEVKPILAFHEETGEKVDRGVRLWHTEHPDKKTDGLLLGLGPVELERGYVRLGWITEYYDDWERRAWWDGAACGWWVEGNTAGLMGVCHASGDFTDRITGGYDGGCYGNRGSTEAEAGITAAWTAAGNRVQWQKDKCG